MSTETIVVGGGLAGLSAAAALASRGQPVRVLESRRHLGGRAGSFLDDDTGTWTDHCQHVGMGCCTALEWLCEMTGLSDCFRRDRQLHFVSPPQDGPGQPPAIHTFRGSAWPAPLHLLGGLGRLKYLNGPQRRSIRHAMRKLARARSETYDQDIASWLHGHGQSDETISGFWEIILVSALSESLDRISVGHARHVFVAGFLSHRTGWELVVPRVPLNEIYDERLGGWLARHGVTVETERTVQDVEFESGRVQGVRLGDGESLTAGQVILAIPSHHVADLLPDRFATAPLVTGLQNLESAPIAAVHLGLDRPFTRLPHAVLVGRLGQWMFRRVQASDSRPEDSAVSTSEGDRVQVVISAAQHVTRMDRTDVIDRVVAELYEIWPSAREVKITSQRLIVAHRAVTSPLPGSEQFRPTQVTPWTGLYLAGDWTRTGWPSTMEGAVRSGLLAAEGVLDRLGLHGSLLPSDLPIARLSRWLLGLSP